ncbi:uncharacterized protein [Cicer arietinum]|uniref:Transcription factor DICHOTOMA-like n=1 Tax=Cicer arietinum TaxID=3827 RepID=A0A1S2Z1L0_CICAR|nr:transcription factor DICHOTOMA-like [Cicer arietinum]
MFPFNSNPYPSFVPNSSASSSSLFSFPFLNPENASSSNNSNNNTLFLDPFSIPYIPTHHHHHPHHHNITNIQETLTNLAENNNNSNNNSNSNNNNNNNNIAIPMAKQDPSTIGGGSHYGISCFLAKKPPKKDRHSKIYTSQGLRDRRVRLSIEIARKFFDLQDMLGFDKASNTLDWLFTKSKKAIKDLTKSKQKNNNEDGDDDDEDAKSFTSSSDCEVVSDIKQHSSNLKQNQDGDGDFSKEKKLKRAQIKESSCIRANKMKESREKARARARERTSNKISNNNNTLKIHQLELKKKYPTTNENFQAFHQSRSSLQDHQLVSSSETPRDDFNVIEESIVIKRKLKPSLMVSHHHHHQHQNHVIPKEATNFNNSEYHSYPNSSPNWDASNNSASSSNRSTFCAIASMNLSTGLQIFGKSWEECTNPRLH